MPFVWLAGLRFFSPEYGMMIARSYTVVICIIRQALVEEGLDTIRPMMVLSVLAVEVGILRNTGVFSYDA